MTPVAFTITLDAPQTTLAESGGKGISLNRMIRNGFPIPDGFIVTTAAYDAYIAANDLQPKIQSNFAAADLNDPVSLEKASSDIRSLFSAPIPSNIEAAIRTAYRSSFGSGDPALAVRSSATAEDLPGASFAGQQDTFLNIHGEDSLLDAVKRCWSSLWTSRALSYRHKENILPEKVSLAVIVEKLVPSECSGVMFTADPVTGARDVVVINAAWGLGEAIVGGQVTPDTIVVDKVSGKVTGQQIGRKDMMTVRTRDGTHEEPVPADKRTRAALNPAQATELARIAVKVEELYGRPMDIEWALDQGRFFIVQARPITALPGHDPLAGEWNDSLAGDYLWTRTNYGEAVPDVMTPCTWSLVQILMADAETSIGPYIVYGNIGGRLYKNLSMDASLAAAFGISPKRLIDMSEDAFGRLPEGMEIPIVRLSRLHLLRMALPVVIRTVFRMRANHKRLPAFLQAAPERCEGLRARIQATTGPEELAALWRTDVAPFFHEACHMLEAAASQGGGAIVMIRRNLQKLVGEDDANALLTGMSAGSGPLASLGPLLSLSQLAKGQIDQATFARQFGHRGPHEMEVSIPRPAEDPNWIEKQLAGLRQAQDDPAALLARQEALRKAAWERLRRRYPRKERSISRKIDRWAVIARDREAARSEVVRSFWVLRSFVQRAGALTGQGESIFFLSIDEILSTLEGDRASLAYIPARRVAYERYCALPPYPVLIRGRFDPFQWAADPGRRSNIFNALHGSMPVKGAITGFPGAAGVVEGRARVIATVEEGDQLQAGEILVTTLTNVGWTPLFPRAAAVVTDIGAPLSHAAIVARELGIPAVVGCDDATMRLRTGDRIRVDGGKGLVEIISAAR